MVGLLSSEMECDSSLLGSGPQPLTLMIGNCTQTRLALLVVAHSGKSPSYTTNGSPIPKLQYLPRAIGGERNRYSSTVTIRLYRLLA